MAYDYYRSSAPGWGTSQFQFAAPPAPAFRPQPGWGGMDFYNAHAVNPDPSLYNSIMSRTGQVGSLGLGRREARYWHRRVYSGMSPLTQLLPIDIGAAAAYEAYRTWKHNSFLYEPLGADPMRMREGLVGMAFAETTRLWQYAGRPMDTFGLRAASEAAASVATVLAERLMESAELSATGAVPPVGAGYGGYRPRRSSFNVPSVIRAGGSPYLGAGAPGIPGGPPTVNPVGAAGGMGGYGMGAGGIPAGAGMGGAGVGFPPSMPPSPIPGAMTGGAMAGGAMAGAGMGGGAGFPPGPMPVPGAAGAAGVPSMGGVMGAGGIPPGGAYGAGSLGAGGLGAGGVGGYGGAPGGAYGGAPGGAYGGAAGGAVPFPGGGQAAQPTVIINQTSRRPRARRYSDSYRDRPRRRRSRSIEVMQVGGAPGGAYGAGGGYGAGAGGMYGGGYGAGGAAGMAGAYGAGGAMGGAYGGAPGAYGGAGYGGAAGAYGGMPGAGGAYGGGGVMGMTGYASSGSSGARAGPGGAPGPTMAAKEEAAEEEREEDTAAGGGRRGGIAGMFRAGMGAGLNATGFGRGGGF